MKIGLIQIDGKLPNLALMKLSTYHKSKGDEVYLMRDSIVSRRLIDFDKVYISCIFDKNKKKAIALQKQFKNAEVGGIGVDNHIKLPEEVEHLMPDYDLYGVDYSMGFITRGCIRNCEFCKVPKHEGLIKKNCGIYEFWDRRHKEIIILDNNLLAIPEQFRKISHQLIKEDLKVDFNQGLDIRLLTEEFAEILQKLKPLKFWRFAFDNLKYEKEFRRGAEMLVNKGLKHKVMIYVLVGFDSTIEEDMRRFEIIKDYGFDSFCMVYGDGNRIIGDTSQLDRMNKTRMPIGNKKRYKDLARYVNRKEIYKTTTWEEYNQDVRNK